MSNSNFDTKFLFQLAQTNNNNSESSNKIQTVDSNSSQLIE